MTPNTERFVFWLGGVVLGVLAMALFFFHNDPIIDELLDIMDDSLCTVEFCRPYPSTQTLAQNGLLVTRFANHTWRVSADATLHDRPVKLSWVQRSRINRLFERRVALPTECAPCSTAPTG